MKSYIKMLSAAFATLVIMLSLTGSAFAAPMAPPVPAGILDPTTIPKYVNQLVIPQYSVVP